MALIEVSDQSAAVEIEDIFPTCTIIRYVEVWRLAWYLVLAYYI